MRDRFISIVLLIPLAILTFSCSQNGPKWKGTIEEEEGVTVVKNPKVPMYGEDVFHLEDELSIGEKEAQEECMFSQLTSIDVDEDENIYVFDSKQGKYIAKIPLKFKPQTWKKNKLYSIEEDEEGFQVVKRYKVTWNY